MLYLITQIAVTLLFTALIGITMGWLLRGLGASRQAETNEARWRARIAQMQQRGGSEPISTEASTAVNPAADRKIAELQKLVRQRDEALAALRAAKDVRAPRHSDPKALATQLQDTTELCSQLQGHLAEQISTTDRVKAQLEQAGKERAMLIERLRERESEIGRMSQERQHAINTIAKLQKEMRTIRGEQSRAAAATAPVARAASDTGPAPADGSTLTQSPMPPSSDRVVSGSERPRDMTAAANQISGPRPAGTPVDAAEMAHKADVTDKPVQPQAQATSKPTLQQNLPITDDNPVVRKASYQPTWRLSAPEGAKDNLQAIFGIGPKLETQLNSLGIFHFEQIGRFQSNDILWVAHRLKSFPGRIVRDRWIEQAQTLANRKRN